MINSVLTIVFYLLVSITFRTNDFPSKNLSHLYDPAVEIRVNFKSYSENKTVTIFIHVAYKSELYNIEDYSVIYELKNNYKEKLFLDFDTLKLQNSSIYEGSNYSIFKVDLDNPDNKNLLVISFHNKHNQKQFYFDVNIDPKRRFANSGILLSSPDGIPFFRNYIKTNEPFNIYQVPNNKSNDLHAYNYRRSFETSEPPMATNQSPSNRTMEIDSAFSLNIAGSLKFSQEGLYFIQADTSSAQGLGFRVTDNYFPKLAKIQDLVNSLRYFSTRNEWNKLNASENLKKAFDDYWMKVTKSEQKARRIIKQYFDQVMLANNYFTNYKEGWKTDQGMIFIIFGNPDEVYRNEEGELWIYKKDDNLPKMRFSYAKVPNIFTENQYTLLRSHSYQNNWFKAVQLWRRGTL